MKFDEAMKALKEGKRIRQIFYADGVYLYMDEDGYIRFNDGEKYRGIGGININDEWEVCGEVCGEVEKDDREDVPDDLKKVFKVVNEFWDTEGYDPYSYYVAVEKEEHYLFKLYNQLYKMNEHYKLDE